MSAKFNVAIIGYSDGTADTITMASPPSDRLALARALVADMPGVVVAETPTAADQWDSPGYDHGTPPNIIWADGYNTLRAAILAQKKPTP